MWHTLLRTLRRYYLGVVFAAYLLSFGLAFVMVFALPIGALSMVFLAVMALIPAVACWSILCALERRFALRKLNRGRCPGCNGHTIGQVEGNANASFQCAQCRGCFSSRGEDVEGEEPSPG